MKKSKVNKFVPKFKSLSFQEKAFDFFKNKHFGAIFYEQGLGKTKIAIDLSMFWLQNKIVDQMLIVAKKNLVNNWYEELKKHTFLIPTKLSNNVTTNTEAILSGTNILLMNYEIINNEFSRIELLCKTRKIGIILDESAKIKNPKSVISKKMHNLSTLFEKKIIMTGTPSANRPEDYWSQIYFLDQGESLGKKFKTFYDSVQISNKLSEDEYERHRLEKNAKNIKNKISNFSLRETKENSDLNLPKKIFNEISIISEDKQRHMYEQIKEELRLQIKKEDLNYEEDVDVILKRIIRLMQVSSNPKMIDDSYDRDTERTIKAKEIIKEIIKNGEKCIIWTSYKFNIDFLKNKFLEFNPVELHGSLNVNIRKKNIREFLENEKVKILIATPQSSKEGLTLICANHCLYYDRTLSLDDYLQSQDRIHRIGQTKTCYYYNLIMEDSIDEWVDTLIRAKSLIAQLTTGDISNIDFNDKIDYNFGDIIRNILKLG